MKRLLTATLFAACTTPQPAPPVGDGATEAATSMAAVAIESPADASRPRYDARGTRLVFHAGDAGSRQIHVLDRTTGAVTAIRGPGDNIDPTWAPDGRIVFASNRDGDFDLWLVDPAGGEPERVTDLPGDETQPTVAAIPFGFYAVHNGICGSPADGVPLDAYYKALFTHRTQTGRAVWFTSVRPAAPPRLRERRTEELAAAADTHGAHLERVSPPGQDCGAPSFSGDGLSAVWTCVEDGRSVVHDAPARFDQSFAAALAAVKTEPLPECQGWQIDVERCLPKLARRYATYPSQPVSSPSEELDNPSVSANQAVLVAQATGGPHAGQILHRQRFGASSWTPFDTTARGAHPAWAPDGSRLAFDQAGRLVELPTDFYLQDVTNLTTFPEVLHHESPLLHRNGFVIRPAEHKEFHVLHDQLRYAGKPQFIAVDVALQVFRDEFLRLIERGEKQAAQTLRALTSSLMRRYVERFTQTANATDRYYAVLFGTAWVPLEAVSTMEQLDFDDRLEAQFNSADLDEETRRRFADLSRPAAQRLRAAVGPVIERVPAAIRSEVAGHLERIMAHAGIEKLAVPGRDRPVEVDFSQFKIRGAYAENDLAGYFLAMNWLGALPLPLDASLGELLTALEATRVADRSGLDAWRQIDALVGSFMGRPVDATLDHVAANRGLLQPFDRKKLTAKLLELRGDVPIRDASGQDRQLAVTMFPRRIGLDVTFFRALTHPAVPERGWPSSVDVFAALGNPTARAHAVAAEPDAMRATYTAKLDALTQRTPSPAQDPGYYATDLYHSWLALLTTVAAPLDVAGAAGLAHMQSPAWRDRQLWSALAGYTQLKHSAVLYAMQDMGVECDGESSFYVAVEQPVIPRPRGFVEPNLPFYEAMIKLTAEVYTRLWDDPRGPTADQWAGEDEPPLNARTFAMQLAEIARTELAGSPITDDQARWIEYVGGVLEPLAMGTQTDSLSFSMGGDGRTDRGVALVTDIHTNMQRGQALQIAVGRIFDLWVTVPAPVGRHLTQGGTLSFYEFTAAMGDRLTDAAWGARLSAADTPAPPVWTASFLEPAP